jgi:hypothetical protein
MLFRLGIALIVIGCILGYFTFREGQLASTASAKPEEISLKALVARGPEGNAHIILKDYVAFPQSAVVWSKEDTPNTYTHVFIPIAPPDATRVEGKPPPKLDALIKSFKAHSDQAVAQLASQPTIKGMVINRIESLGKKDRELLQQDFPATDFNRCLIVQDGREPSGYALILLMGAGTLVLIAGGVGLLVLGARRR